MKNTIIKLEDIKKIFSTEEVDTYALAGVDLEIFEGDYVSISGPSGCGKSTLLSILGLLDEPTSGSYTLNGKCVSKINKSESATIRSDEIGFIFQQFNLIDELSVEDNISLPLRYSDKNYSELEIEERIHRCLKKVGMEHRRKHKPNQLSGGQQQRIAIARALVADPSILLVDEPTGNLDSKNGDIIMEMLSTLNASGTTICMVTHDPRYADMAHKQYYLLDGKIAQTTKEFKEAV
ncbi:ABC transporter ATP-binding protein [Alteromonas sp. ASW11-130]|uniref:ABC transporter ATP-binding protein n=1 Tax=Alteromonas sp. ASW11-130 TaxID=3015775 RepID=UPI002241E961|nr:ABC transporter ATP-binding protein [Alteromonas sp. ASW11-130]MCW8092493.1 ABC transporter ATP-binding protein [Alteromonas sp. ASW11-130]